MRGKRRQQRSIVVTGAAAGIGRAVVKRFLSKGWRVGAFDVDAALLDALAAECANPYLHTARLDVTDPQGWRVALAEFCGEGPLDVLVNNAGVLQGGAFEELPLDAALRTVDVNLKGTLIGCHAAHEYLIRSASPQIVNLCSASAIYGQAELVTYSATKFGVRGLSEGLDLEWRKQGIRVQAMWPLYVQTDMTRGLDVGTTRSLGVRLVPDDVAKAIERAAARPRVGNGLMSIHRAVGAQAKVSLASSSLSPSWVLRLVNARLAGR